MAPLSRRPLTAALTAVASFAVVLGMTSCAPKPAVGETLFTSSTELASAMTAAGVECKDPKLVQNAAGISMSTCQNPDFPTLNIVVFDDQVAFARLLQESKKRDGKEVSATTTIYGNNWATLGAAKDAETVKAAAEKLKAQLATQE